MLDKFYTHRNTVNHCIKIMRGAGFMNESYLYAEPSAGDGSFLVLDYDTIAFDIAPEGDNIIQQDWLQCDTLPKDKPIVVYGNPPFGHKAKLAVALMLIGHRPTIPVEPPSWNPGLAGNQ